jgi:hypothetical protein
MKSLLIGTPTIGARQSACSGATAQVAGGGRVACQIWNKRGTSLERVSMKRERKRALDSLFDRIFLGRKPVPTLSRKCSKVGSAIGVPHNNNSRGKE